MTLMPTNCCSMDRMMPIHTTGKKPKRLPRNEPFLADRESSWAAALISRMMRGWSSSGAMVLKSSAACTSLPCLTRKRGDSGSAMATA